MALVEAAEAIDRSFVEREFELLNAGSEPVIVRSLKASCGCETPILLIDGKPQASGSIMPSHTAIVRVNVRLSKSDWMGKRVQLTVLGDDESRPLASLAIDVRQNWFSLSRGQIALTEGSRNEFTMSIAAGLPRTLVDAPLVTKAPWLRVTEEKSTLGVKGETVRHFVVTSDETLEPGRYQAPLSFKVPDAEIMPAASAMRRVTLTVHREVANDLRAEPATVPIPLASAPRQIILWSMAKGALDGVSGESVPSGLSIKLGKVMTMGGSTPRYMRIATIARASSGGSVGAATLVFRTRRGSKAVVTVGP